jgi:hypothetical protein
MVHKRQPGAATETELRELYLAFEGDERQDCRYTAIPWMNVYDSNGRFVVQVTCRREPFGVVFSRGREFY